MNTLSNHRYLLISLIFAVVFICSCEKTEFTMETYTKPLLQWGASEADIVNHMKDNSLISNSGGYMYYRGRRQEDVISYHLNNGQLTTVSTFVPRTITTLSHLTEEFKGYKYLGEISSHHIYINESTNTFATIGKSVKGKKKYFTINWTYLHSIN